MSQTPKGRGSACGKLILAGEHFVVHGAPALALPLSSVSTEVEVFAAPGTAGPELVSQAPAELLHTAEQLVRAGLQELGLTPDSPLRIVVRSTVPLGCGLGSSAAFAVALCAALGRAAGRKPELAQLNQQAHALERLVHGNPSGIDNTVVSHRRPVWFVKGRDVELLDGPGCLQLVLASSGAPGSTREAVAGVQALRAAEPTRFGEICGRAEALVHEVREAFEAGDAARLGPLMNENHELLQAIGVSTPVLDRLVDAAREGGALGAKLTGGGRGGYVVALVGSDDVQPLRRALQAAGAAQLLQVTV